MKVRRHPGVAVDGHVREDLVAEGVVEVSVCVDDRHDWVVAQLAQVRPDLIRLPW